MGILGEREIWLRRDEIFSDGTFSKRCLRGAAYDLRLRDDPELKTTGKLVSSTSTLLLGKGQRATVETHESLTMPWDLSGNVSVKAKWSLMGLFVTQGLFIDPGFGWVGKAGQCSPSGARLRFMLTNMGEEPIPIRLGEEGDPVIGIQFLPVEEPLEREPIEERQADPQALAVFTDISELRNLVEATKQGVDAKIAEVAENVVTRIGELDQKVQQVDGATNQIVLFGVFLVAATLLGALIAFTLSVVSSGHGAEHTVKALNQLDTSRPWTMVILIAVVLVIVLSVMVLAGEVRSFYRKLLERRSK